MSTKINDDSMGLEIDGRVIATASFSEYAAADSRGAWIVSSYPGRLFTRNQAITGDGARGAARRWLRR
jgi:DNA-binding transcriptional MocR family regulator